MEEKKQNRLRKIIEKPIKYIGSKVPTKIKHMAQVFIKQNVYRDFINYRNNIDNVIENLKGQGNLLLKIQKGAGKYLKIKKITFVVISSVLRVLKPLIIKFSGKPNMRFSRFSAQSFYKVGNLRIHYVINV